MKRWDRDMHKCNLNIIILGPTPTWGGPINGSREIISKTVF
jgi:hypothetical protein